MKADFSWAEVGRRVRDIRVARGLSQQSLANKSRITQAGLARIETGQTNPQIETLGSIAAALRTSVRQLMTGNSISGGSALVARILRILESGDPAAITTVENATATAETLLRRSGRIVTDFGFDKPRGKTGVVTDDMARIMAEFGYTISNAGTTRKQRPGKYVPIRRSTRLAHPPDLLDRPSTKVRKGFDDGE